MKSDDSLGKNYYPGLTSLRAIAALMVYLHHFNPLPPSLSLFGFSFSLKDIVNKLTFISLNLLKDCLS